MEPEAGQHANAKDHDNLELEKKSVPRNTSIWTTFEMFYHDHKVEPDAGFEIVVINERVTHNVVDVARKLGRVGAVGQVSVAFVLVGHKGGETVVMDGNVAHPAPPPTDLLKGHKIPHDAHA